MARIERAIFVLATDKRQKWMMGLLSAPTRLDGASPNTSPSG
jgi:hypothetical protein